MKILSVIVTYNGATWIRKCISSLLSSSFSTDIIVIDNKSQDETVTIVKNEFPTVEIIETGENLGFGRANNIGLKKAIVFGYDYAFLLNQDAWVDRNVLEELVKCHTNNLDFGLISPMHFNGTGTGLEIKFNEYINVNDCPGLVSDKFAGRPLCDIYPIRFVNAAAWLLSADCLREVGGFDPLFYHYGEDEDYISRVKIRGLQVGICPKAIIYHDSIYRTWDELKWNINRLIIINLLELKMVGTPLRSNVLRYIKFSLDKGSSLILFRKFKEFRTWFQAFRKTFSYISQVKRSRKESYNKQSFL